MATKYKTQNSLIPGKIWKGRRASIFYWKNSEVQVTIEALVPLMNVPNY